MVKRTVGLMVGLLFVGILVGGCGQGQQAANQYSGLSVSPSAAIVRVGETQRFKLDGLVKSSSATTNNVAWVVVGGIGTIDATGVFTATAEGAGTVEARMDSLVGKADLMVSALQGKTIRGTVKNINITSGVVSSAVVLSGGKTAISGSDGSYTLEGVSAKADTISAAAPGFVSTTVQSTGETINMPMGVPVSFPYYSYPYETTRITGRLIDENGDPVSNTSSELVFGNESYSSSSYIYSGSDGSFSNSFSLPKNITSLPGYLMVVKEINGTYKSAMKELTLVRGVTLEAGNIVVNGEVATIMGSITAPNDFTLSGVNCGIQLTASIRLTLQRAYNGGGISGNQFTLRVPVTPAGKKYWLSATAGKGDDISSKYATNLIMTAGENKYELILPEAITPTYPTSEQTGVGVAPKFEWSSLGSNFNYFVIVGNQTGIKWWGFTKSASLTYPFFPLGSGGENSNLQSGQMYYVGIIGYENPNIDLSNFKSEDIQNITAFSQMSSIAFTVGAMTANGIKALNVAQKSEFDKKVKEFLMKMGIPYERTSK